MRKALLIYVIFLITFNCDGETFTLTPGYKKAYHEILRLRFEAANQIIATEKRVDPNNAAYCYLEAYEDFLKTIISEEQTNYQSFADKKSSRIRQLSTISKKSPWLLYTQAQINLQDGVASVKEGEYVQAALNIKKAYSLFSENHKLFPDFKPNKAGIGLLYVLVGSVPDSYKWVPGMFGMEGNVKQGIRLLHESIAYNPPDNEWPFLFSECMFITTFITFNLAGTEENIAMLRNVLEDQRLKSEIKNSPLLIYAVASFHFSQGQNDKALELLKNRPIDVSYYNFRYLDYLTGLAYLNKLDLSARIYFLKYITQFKGRNFIKSAYQRVAWSYLVENDTSNYIKYINRVLLFGNAGMESDKQAQKDASSPDIPDPGLLKARLLFDGGYYSRAKNIMYELKKDGFSLDQKIEYSYRIARINHKTGEIAKAKENYYHTYKSGRGLKSYFAAYSILNLGILYENEGKTEQALWCYKECLKMDFNEYKTSIHQKAKAGLSRIARK